MFIPLCLPVKSHMVNFYEPPRFFFFGYTKKPFKIITENNITQNNINFSVKRQNLTNLTRFFSSEKWEAQQTKGKSQSVCSSQLPSFAGQRGIRQQLHTLWFYFRLYRWVWSRRERFLEQVPLQALELRAALEFTRCRPGNPLRPGELGLEEFNSKSSSDPWKQTQPS